MIEPFGSLFHRALREIARRHGVRLLGRVESLIRPLPGALRFTQATTSPRRERFQVKACSVGLQREADLTARVL
jgi:hypothetical protein